MIRQLRKFDPVRRKFGAPLALIALAALAATGFPPATTVAAATAEAAEAAARPPVNIAVLLSSRTDVCHDLGQNAAIRRFATIEQERINKKGGIGGRKLQLRFLDDRSQQDQTTANLKASLTDPATLAVIGLTNSNRAKVAFDALGADIDRDGVPFISDISVNSIFAKHANVFTTRASQDDERVPVTAEFIKAMNYSRIAFVGQRDQVFSTSLADGLKSTLGDKSFVADHRLTMKNDKLDPAEIEATVADLKAKSPDFAMMIFATARTAEILKVMIAQGVTPPLYMVGRIDQLPPEIQKAYPNDLFQLAWDTLPEVFNDRLRKTIVKQPPDNWLFEGRKINEAPGWASGECKERPLSDVPDPLTPANLRAIGFGTQFADMIALVSHAAGLEGPKSTIAEMRSIVIRELKTSYATGRGAFRGSFENWSFDRTSRSAARTPFIVMQPRGLGRPQLAPLQFARMKNGSLRQIETLYADIDLIRTYNVDDNDKSFFAEFYLSMRSNQSASVDQIEFVNAYLDPRTNGRQITVTNLHDGSPSAAYPNSMKFYKVSGKFLFEPELGTYPFDSQSFSISIQPKRADAPFIVQPPPHRLRDQHVSTDGWDVKGWYVGYDSDFVPVIDAFTHEPSVVPYYSANYVWLMSRQTTDYFLRVVVPLAFIMIVAYVSIFIPQVHFEAIVTVQVTALLSAVALYFSIPKLASDTATVSDRIFVFDYMIVCLMIVISILRVNRHVAARPWLKATLAAVHIGILPLLVVAMAIYVHGITTASQ